MRQRLLRHHPDRKRGDLLVSKLKVERSNTTHWIMTGHPKPQDSTFLKTYPLEGASRIVIDFGKVPLNPMVVC